MTLVLWRPGPFLGATSTPPIAYSPMSGDEALSLASGGACSDSIGVQWPIPLASARRFSMPLPRQPAPHIQRPKANNDMSAMLNLDGAWGVIQYLQVLEKQKRRAASAIISVPWRSLWRRGALRRAACTAVRRCRWSLTTLTWPPRRRYRTGPVPASGACRIDSAGRGWAPDARDARDPPSRLWIDGSMALSPPPP